MANTALSSALGAFCWEAEDSFADAADDTYTTRHQVRSEIDVSGLQRPLIDRGGTYQRLNRGEHPIAGAFGLGTFTVSLDASGAGTTTVGDLTEPNLSKLLAHVFGLTDWTAFGGQAAGTGDADTLNVDGGSEAFSGGSLCRVGELNDGRGGGQAYAITSFAGGVVELATGMPVAAADNDVVYAMGMIHPSVSSNVRLTSSGAAYNNTIRCVLMTANYQYVCRGCACTGARLTGLGPGELPMWELTFSTVAWEAVAQTFPSATATADYKPAVSTTGSCFIQAAGTTTSSLHVVRNFELNIGQGMQPVYAQGGENVGQNVLSWCRVPAESTLTITIEAEAATASPTYAGWATNTTARHICYTANTTDTTALAVYAPNAYIMESIPTQTSVDGLNMVTMTFKLLTHTAGASDLQRSGWRIGMG